MSAASPTIVRSLLALPAFVIFVASAYAQAESIADVHDYDAIVYVDPSAPDPGNGSSPEKPLHSWIDVRFQPATAYLQKRGTRDRLEASITVNGTNILLGAYGDETAPRPEIHANVPGAHAFDFRGAGSTIRDLRITSSEATSLIRFASWNHAEDGTVYNCELLGQGTDESPTWAVRVFANGARILSTRIQYTKDDGIFVQNAANVEIANCHISAVNQAWLQEGVSPRNGKPWTEEINSPGDGIQLDGAIDGFHIHHNTIDRTDTQNKFCIIANARTPGVTGVIENNHILFHDGVAGIYAAQFSAEPMDFRILIRSNLFESSGGGAAVYAHAARTVFSTNIFENPDAGILLVTPAATSEIHHNTFHGISNVAIRGDQTTMNISNNIFDLADGAKSVSTMRGDTRMTHNLFTEAESALGSHPIIGEPRFTNPTDHNYTPGAGSPAIEAGIPIEGLTKDARGQAYIGEPDVGAFESAN
ncbi:right-handed parallel beta-helix repeat-containing protein [bacterium]|nr:right-handed parallel beta-helix repeat-containing protein [bacterium]